MSQSPEAKEVLGRVFTPRQEAEIQADARRAVAGVPGKAVRRVFGVGAIKAMVEAALYSSQSAPKTTTGTT